MFLLIAYLIIQGDSLTYIISLHRPGWKGWTGVMQDGWRMAQFSILSLIPEINAAARTPLLVFVTMATGTRRTSAMTVSASLPSSTVRNSEGR